jgi:hypothetical protein
MAHHVNVLVEAGMLCVVRTRRVRAIDERFYGRTARLFRVGEVPHGTGAPSTGAGPLTDAAVEAVTAHRDDMLRATLRHVRIPDERADEFWGRVLELAQDFVQLPRSGTTTYGFVAGLYPTDHPALPEVFA